MSEKCQLLPFNCVKLCTMKLNHDLCYAAIKSRDARFDGRFFTAVLTTGIYCRPICPATRPQAQNVQFYNTAAEAGDAGFRPCLRCRPESAPGSPEWDGSSALVARAMRLINEGIMDDGVVVPSPSRAWGRGSAGYTSISGPLRTFCSFLRPLR